MVPQKRFVLVIPDGGEGKSNAVGVAGIEFEEYVSPFNPSNKIASSALLLGRGLEGIGSAGRCTLGVLGKTDEAGDTGDNVDGDGGEGSTDDGGGAITDGGQKLRSFSVFDLDGFGVMMCCGCAVNSYAESGMGMEVGRDLLTVVVDVRTSINNSSASLISSEQTLKVSMLRL